MRAHLSVVHTQISFLLPAAGWLCQYGAVLWLISLALGLAQGFSADTGEWYLSPENKAGLFFRLQGAGGERRRAEVVSRDTLNVESWRARLGSTGIGKQRYSLLKNPPQLLEKESCVQSWMFPCTLNVVLIYLGPFAFKWLFWPCSF